MDRGFSLLSHPADHLFTFLSFVSTPFYPPPQPMQPDRAALLTNVRRFLGRHTPYDLLPPSSRLPVLDTRLVVRKALAALLQHGE
jgi:hypothetical protein